MDNNLEHIREILSSLQAQSLDDSIIKDNKLYFDYKLKNYVCSMPSSKNISDAQKYKDKFKMDKILNEKVYSKNQIKAILKQKQNIDIDDLENQRFELQKELQTAYLDLALTDPKDTNTVLEMKGKIKEIENSHLTIFSEIMEHLSPALENLIEKVYVEYLTIHCTFLVNEEEGKEPVLTRVWNKQEDFDNDTTGVVSEAVKFMTYLLLKANR